MIIVHRADNTLRLVTQPDHAAGAGQLAAQWQRPAAWDAALWRRFVEAVRCHDDGWAAWEQAPPLDEAGWPYSFKNLPTPQHAQIWRNGIKQQAAADPYRGLILALHARWLYTRLARDETQEETAAVHEFVAWLNQRIDALASQLTAQGGAAREAVQPTSLDQARRLIGFFDMVSLVLLGALPANDWPEPLPFGGQCGSLRLHLATPERDLSIEPWPFERDEVTVTMPAYDMGPDGFASSEALGLLMRETEAVTLQFILQSGEYQRG